MRLLLIGQTKFSRGRQTHSLPREGECPTRSKWRGFVFTYSAVDFHLREF